MLPNRLLLCRMRKKAAIYSVTVVVWFLMACSKNIDRLPNKTTLVNQQDCTTMSDQDKEVMRFLQLSFAYSQNAENRGKALVISKHACKLPHDLPDVFYNTALLFQFEGDTVQARGYLRKEIVQDLRILLSPDVPECKKDRFRKCLYETCAALGKQTNFIVFDDFFKHMPYGYRYFFPAIIGGE